MATPLPWSHSSINQFETCGRQYEEIKVLRNFQDQKNPASLWGDEFHKAAERWLKGMADLPADLDIDARLAHLALSDALPANMVQYEGYLKQFITRPGITLAEQEYAINRQLQPCEFFGADVWGRGIIDVLTLLDNVAWVDDHKTGKNRKKDMQQLIIFALLTFYHHPQIDTVHCTFHWLQLGATDTETFYRHEIDALWMGYPATKERAAWEGLVPRLGRYAEAFHQGIFQPRRSGLCGRWCAVKTCEHWGSSR